MKRILSFSFSLSLSGAMLVGATRADELPDVSAHSPWMLHERNEDAQAGYVTYRRELPDSEYSVWRLEAVIDATPDAVALAAQRNVGDPDAGPSYMRKRILRDDGEITIVYTYIDMPLVSDRDVTTRAVRSFDAQTGSHRVEWQTSDEGPEPQAGVVRLEKSSGSWVFSPLPDGRTSAVYESHTEIGGAIPAWLVDSLMKDTVVDAIVTLRARVERDLGRMAAESSDPRSRAR